MNLGKTLIKRTKYLEKKYRRPYILIYGDDEDSSISKAIWAATSGLEVQLVSPDNKKELSKMALEAILIVIRVEGVKDSNCHIAKDLWKNSKVVSDIIGISEDLNLYNQMKIMAQGFDNIYSSKIIDHKDFKNAIRHKVRKGEIRLSRRIQVDEYTRLKAALSASPAAFIIFDEYQRVFFVSSDYKAAFEDHSKRLERGTSVTDVFASFIKQNNYQEVGKEYIKLQEFWNKLDGQAEFTLKDGKIWKLTAETLPNEQGTILTTVDITEYAENQRLFKKKSIALEEALYKEQQSGEIQTQFINMVSHEFRTPLTIIDGNAQIIEKRGETLDGATLVKRSKAIRSSVSRLIYMMEGILSSNLLDSGQMETIEEPVNLALLIEELCQEQEQLSPSLDIQRDLDSLPEALNLDRKVITLSITNLISNAIKYSEGPAHISITSYVKNHQLYIIIDDLGIGVPDNEIEKIFERYYRSSRSKNVTGSGIGLHLVKGLIHLHGGEISAKSKETKGTTFTIIIPLNS